MGTDYVTITDNADPRMHVLVFRRGRDVDGSRLVCMVEVFRPNRSATENSLIATDRSIVVENNYGYRNFTSTMFGETTEPGIARIDLDADDGSCRTVWTSNESVPNVVSQLSLANGLLYTYTKPRGPGTTNAWYFTAIDFETGKTVYKQLTGTGFLYDSHYSAMYLGPDETAYVGVAGGLVSVRETGHSEPTPTPGGLGHDDDSCRIQPAGAISWPLLLPLLLLVVLRRSSGRMRR